MTPQTVLGYVKAEPFRPFRIRMASGQALEIRHPEMILVGRTTARVYDAVDDARETWHEASLLTMETIEPMDAPVRQRGDG
jgi:hypothetical protein